MKKLFLFSFCIIFFNSCEREEIINEFETANLITSSCNLTTPDPYVGNTIPSGIGAYPFSDRCVVRDDGSIFDCLDRSLEFFLLEEFNTSNNGARPIFSETVVSGNFNTDDNNNSIDIGQFANIPSSTDFSFFITTDHANAIYEASACRISQSLEALPALASNEEYFLEVFMITDFSFAGPIAENTFSFGGYNIIKNTF